jgi:hypothetical protein
MVDSLRLITREDQWRSNVSASVIEVLEEMMAKAKNGEIDGVVIAATRPDGSGTYRWSKMSHATSLLGVLTIVIQKLAMDD